MNPSLETLSQKLDRRMLLRLGAVAGLSTAALASLARAADEPDLLPQVRAMIARWVGPGKLPGAVASLGVPGQEAQFVSAGTQGFVDFDAMDADTLFRIYSMTKPVTGMAAMILIDEGKLRLDQPLADVLPAYRDMRVLDTYDGPLDRVHRAPGPITIRQVLTHTSGLAYTVEQGGPVKRLMEEKGLVPGRISRLPIPLPGFPAGPVVPTLAAFADGMAKVPLVADPGTAWHYSAGLDVMGRVIEVVSGQSFAAFVSERLLDPLGMSDTDWQVPQAKAHRLATNHAVFGGALIPIDEGDSSIFLEPPPFCCGGSGLVSTPRDYDRFLRMLAQGGMFAGKRVMSEAAVRLGTGNLLPPGVTGEVGFAPNSGFGAGGRVGLGAEGGVFGWAGAAGTVGMVDARRGLRSQFFAQFMPPTAFGVLAEFQSALKADVTGLLEKRT
ncbi:serine hydrolase domain-containing protein [Novosphingobium colocasiae]|uniref:Serine hydrolase n=1 Tax=Novosphingobium colocasiae TaxID=1256513 RepID=A0A918UG40_9SPHN|nr:serine hydrolase domain-containing protein [Novosphingobium colocasiae]GGZ03682.1 serine hydrolase [Novosphingobium colocasiae]